MKSADKVINRPRKERNRRTVVAMVCLVIVLVLPCVSSVASMIENTRDKVVVGSENFTEALILGNIYSQLIQGQTDLEVEEKFNLNGTMITMSAMESGELDTFTDYTGVLSANVLKESLSTDPEEVYQSVKEGMQEQYQMEVSKSLGFSNTYVFAVTKETAQEYNLTTLSQLIANASSLRLGCTTAFTQREDLLPKLEKDFDVSFKSVEGLEGNIRYQALTSGKIDVIDAFETDALLLSMDLVKLENDIGFFPPYQAVAVTRNETFEKYPELEEVFAKLEGAISTDEMMEMNYQVDVEGRTPKDVAVDFLEAEGLI